MASSSIVRKAAVLVAGGGVYCTAVYMTYHYLQMSSKEKDAVNNDFSHITNPNRTEQFQNIASCYDDEIGRDEFFMGMNLLRRWLLYFHARGTILEVGAGTARNLSYYPQAVKRVVLTDTSDQMLLQAKRKIQALPAEQQARFAVLEADAASLFVDNHKLQQLPDQAFDTVIDTFGLCSYDDPVAVLNEMARVCKQRGKILLLEHGRSKTWDFVTNHLDKHAEQHAAKWGCVWNRDLDQLLDQANVEVQVLTKWHFGTTYYVVCRPKQQKQVQEEVPFEEEALSKSR